ncbi:MAG: sensor histidine kinase [Nocardioides sp.]|uniref:sensor histidine kinase n=1 Tax=Nocardioides sp. TaxID=35761 RepID=UPI003EFCECCD
MPLTPQPSAVPLPWWSHTWRIVVCALVSFVALLLTVIPAVEGGWAYPTPGQVLLDLVLGAAAFVLVLLRRSRPVSVAVLVTLASAFSSAAAGPALLVTISLATRRRWVEMLPVGVLGVAAGMVFTWWIPVPDELPWWANAALFAVVTAALMGWGMYIGSRRELLATLQDRARRAEAETALRGEKARSDERARIAHEMHDVLAHKISQVSMYAGALSYRDGLSEAEVHEAAALIQQKANEALTDLRSVLGVLRDPDSGDRVHRPQPTLADLDELVAGARAAGQSVEVDLLLPTGGAAPQGASRTAYRVVQEALTNAHKHAPGAKVRVRVTGEEEGGIQVEVRNRLGFTRAHAVPGAGLGLIGLRERLERADGELAAGEVGDEYVLRGWIPWEA